MPFPDHTPSGPVLLQTLKQRFGPRTLIVDSWGRMSYAQLEERSARLARALLADGAGKGSHVGILMPNGADWLVAFFAAARIGAVAVPVNTFYQVQELAWTLRHSDVSLLLTASSFLSHDYLERLEASLPELAGQSAADGLFLPSAPYLRKIRVWGECDRPWALPGGDPETDPPAGAARIDAAFLREVEDCVTPADTMVMVYSSGSTADPKGALHTHGGVVRHAYNLAHVMGVRTEDCLYSPMPFFWVGGLMTAAMIVMVRGARLLAPERFDAGETLELMEREGVTNAVGWQHYGKSMADHPSFAQRDLSRLRASAMHDILPPSLRPADPGLRSNSLGMTETAGPHTYYDNTVDLPVERRGTFGLPLEGVEHKIVDPESGETLPQGEQGEVCVRGYSRMRGLHRIEREDSFDRDGYYHTGDSGWFDADGWLYFKGRLGEMIKTGGANVTPGEVETVLGQYEEVSEAYVTSIPDAERGELVAAAVVLKSGRDATPEDLRGRLRRDLSAYKVPRHVWVCQKAQLPFTDSGKIKKKALSALLAHEFADA